MKQKPNRTRVSYDDGSPEPFNVNYIPEKIGKFTIDIDDGISCVAQFQDAIRVLEMSDEDNPVQINLQSPGGSLDATDAFIHGMRKCKGHIHIVATGNCSSAASLILLQADSFELSEGFNSLIHNGSLGSIGNFNEFVAKAKFDSEVMPKTFRSYYEGFLTEQEIDGVIRGDNLWIDAQGWMDRVTYRNEYFKAKEEAERKPPRKPRKKKVPEEL